MADNWICINCGEAIGHWDKVCSNCGYHQFGENDEFYPSKEDVNKIARGIRRQTKVSVNTGLGGKRKRLTEYSEEEILGTGMYPKDENYKMSLISRILGRK